MSQEQEQKIVKVLYLVLITIAGLAFASPFFVSIFFGGTVALAMYPLQERLENKGMSRKRSSFLLTTLFTFLISIPLFFFLVKGTLLVTQQLNRISHSEKLKDQGVEQLIETFRHQFVRAIHKAAVKHDYLDFLTEEKINTYLDSVNGFLMKFFSGLASSLPEMVLLLLVLILCLHSFLFHAGSIRSFFQQLFGFDEDHMNEFVSIYIRDSKQVYISNIATGAIQSVIVATTVSLIGLSDFFLVFFVTFILSFIPVIGAAPVAGVFALYAYFIDQTTHAIIIVGIALFTGVIDNILRPWLSQLGESHCPGIVSFIGVLGGALLLGFPGLFIGLLVSHLSFDTIPLFWKELSKTHK